MSALRRPLSSLPFPVSIAICGVVFPRPSPPPPQAIERLCKGRGGSIPLSCNVMEWRWGDVCMYAPLQEAERKELALFSRFLKLNT